MKLDKKTIEKWMEQVNACIDELAAHPYHGHPVGEVLEDALRTRGKMIRPRLVLISGAFGPEFEKNKDRLCRLAAMVELTHMASLIHDDIIDDGQSRRGRPSIQSKYGKDAAVYAGDFLMSRISYRVAMEDMNRPGAILAKTVEEMCTGEIGQSLCRFREDVTMEEYLKNIHGKTAALFMAACRIGAEEGGCSPALAKEMETFGECLGIMFQLRDDLLDFISSRDCEGKETHRDFLEGIYTMPVICAIRHPRADKELLPLLKANREGGLTREELVKMERLVSELGGIEETLREICKRQLLAEKILLSSLPQNEQVLSLLAMLRKLGEIGI